MSATQRIIQYLECKSISKYKFYKETGLSNSFLDKNKNIGSDKCAIIIDQYPDINPIWLLTGRGEMLVGRAETEAKQPAAAPAAANSELVAYLERQMAEMKREIQEKDRTIWDLEAKIEGLACELRRRKEAPAEDHPLADVG